MNKVDIPKDMNVVYRSRAEAGVLGTVANMLGLSETHQYSSGVLPADELSQERRPLWQQLVGESVLHIHSPAFREEFYGLIRHDEIHVRLFSMHLFLLADRMRMSRVTIFNHGLASTYEHKKTMFALGARRFNRIFYQNTYQNFHSHLPEELFYTDFKTFFKKTNKNVYKVLGKTFKQMDSAFDQKH